MWQIQNCGQFSVTGKAVVELFGAMMGDGDGVYGAYEYDLSDGRDLSAFGIEQQSGIIADYYVLNETIKNGPWGERAYVRYECITGGNRFTAFV